MIQINPINGNFGGDISGVDIDNISDNEFAEIHKA